ncbi:MAG: archaeosortase/exosortase family protein [Candidatus Aenigmarchaeota archaeon]|nr:archaeosortase/exosortase family protein [Candidatus Aenigmarchaeota archaeon]
MGIKLFGNFFEDYPVFAFLIKFNLFALPMYAAILLEFDFYILQQFTANIVYSLLQFLNFSPVIDGVMITIPVQNGTWAALMSSACTGWKSALLFLALVAATPGKSMHVKKIALIFVPIILVVNIIRIVFMFWVASADLAYFELAHSLIWSWGMIFTVFGLWILWMLKSTSESRVIVNQQKKPD